MIKHNSLSWHRVTGRSRLAARFFLMFRRILFRALLLACVAGLIPQSVSARDEDALASGFASPPLRARLRGYWWWLNGHVNEEATTKDLEWMKAIGMGGGLVFDANGSSLNHNGPSRRGRCMPARNGGRCSSIR